MVRRNRLGMAETERPSRTGKSIAALQFTCLAPSLVGEELVVGRDPQRRPVPEVQTNDLGLTLVEALDDRPHMQLPQLVGGDD